jgi:hypothetical protein
MAMNGMNWPLGPRLPSSLKAKRCLASSRRFPFRPVKILSASQNANTHHEKVTDLVGLHVKEVTAHTKSAMTLIALLGSRAVRVSEAIRALTASAATQDETLVTDQPELLGLTASAATQDATLATDQPELLGLTVSAATQDETLVTDQLDLLGLTASAATQDETLVTDQLDLLGLTASAATHEEIHLIAPPDPRDSTPRTLQVQQMAPTSRIQRIATTARVTGPIGLQLTSAPRAVRIPVARVVLQRENM